MSKKTLFWILLVTIVLVVVSVGTYAVIERLSDQAVWVLVGGVGALVIVGSVGVLFIVKDLAQAYVMRRLLADDALSDLRQMAMMSKLMGNNRSPNVNLRLPPGQRAQPWQVITPQQLSQGQPVGFDGGYRDTIANDEVEIE